MGAVAAVVVSAITAGRPTRCASLLGGLHLITDRTLPAMQKAAKT